MDPTLATLARIGRRDLTSPESDPTDESPLSFFRPQGRQYITESEILQQKRMLRSTDGPEWCLFHRNPNGVEPVVSISTASRRGETTNRRQAKIRKKNTPPEDTKMGIRTTFLAATTCVLSLFCLTRAAEAAPPIEVGQPFPDLVLPALDGGEPVRMSDFRPKPVVLHIFASW